MHFILLGDEDFTEFKFKASCLNLFVFNNHGLAIVEENLSYLSYEAVKMNRRRHQVQLGLVGTANVSDIVHVLKYNFTFFFSPR